MFAEIADLFGKRVASLVAEVTDDKKLPKQVRKDKQIAGASYKSDGASVIKLADKTGNLLAVHEEVITRARRTLARAREVLAAAAPKLPVTPFEKELARRAAKARKSGVFATIFFGGAIGASLYYAALRRD